MLLVALELLELPEQADMLAVLVARVLFTSPRSFKELHELYR
jgi:hypothetical protein